MKFWQVASFSEPEQLVGIAQAAEECGFHGVMVSDHLFFPGKLDSKYPYSPDGRPAFEGDMPFPDPWVAIGAMAAATERLHFGTMVYILPLRDPFHAAKAVATASLLSSGRVALGVGAGWIREEYDALGVDFTTRGKRMDEMIEVMRRLWGGGMVEHHGRFFDFAPLEMSPTPGGRVPVYVGGMAAPALRRAGRLGDGWIGTGNDPADVPVLLERVHGHRRAAGREDEPFETIVPLAAPPDPELYRRMEAEHGVTATTAWPFNYVLGPSSSLAQKRDAMRRYADEVIAKVG